MDILASIHATIEEIKSAQKVMEDKEWYFTTSMGGSRRRGKHATDFEKRRGLCKNRGCCYLAPSGDFSARVGWC